MYVTRPLSLYKSNPSALSLPPPEGPNSGYLVLQDVDDPRYLFGLARDRRIRDLPFPQNKLHEVIHGSQENKSYYPIYFIPVISQPLSSNSYYAIKTTGRHKGEASASSTENEMITCCLCNCAKDVEPEPLDPTNSYQQFRVSMNTTCHRFKFLASSVAPDGIPPLFLRRGWDANSLTAKNFSLGEAAGLDQRLRAHLPDFNFPLSYKASTPVVVGKWYCPFMFIKDVIAPRDQVKESMYYEMTLEQQWERIFYCGNENRGSGQGNSAVFVDISVPTESIKVAGMDAIQADQEDNNVVWFNRLDGRMRVGLSSLVVERMMWEEERVGWVPKEDKQVKVVKVEEFGGVGTWARYGCYILVERFVLKKMDGSVLCTYSFNHTQQMRSKWE